MRENVEQCCFPGALRRGRQHVTRVPAMLAAQGRGGVVLPMNVGSQSSTGEGTMTYRFAIAALFGLSLPLTATPASAEDVKVFSSTALKGVLAEVGPQYEKETGNTLVFTIGPAAVMKAQIDQGGAFDVAIVTPLLMDGLASAGKIDTATRAVIARSPLAVSARAGAPKPDVATVDALKHALLNAKSIGYNGQGASRAS